MATDHTTSTKLSKYLAQYLFALKIHEKNEVYETVLLMVLNNAFLKSLNNLIEDNLKKVKKSKGNIGLEIHSSKEYEKATGLVCKSKYFTKNFNKAEIERKRVIAKNIIIEIAIQSVSYMIFKDVKLNVNFYKVVFPDIKHRVLNKERVPKLELTFNEGTSLNEIVKYLKEVLEVKNTPKKKKMSLGQGFRMLQISNEIKDKTLNHNEQIYEYNEQVVTREMLSRYKEKVSVENVAKSLQRIKKIQKAMNSY